MGGAIPTIAEAARLIAKKELSPVELTRACLARIHALDNRLHAFILLTEERALAEARAAEAAREGVGGGAGAHGQGHPRAPPGRTHSGRRRERGAVE